MSTTKLELTVCRQIPERGITGTIPTEVGLLSKLSYLYAPSSPEHLCPAKHVGDSKASRVHAYDHLALSSTVSTIVRIERGECRSQATEQQQIDGNHP